MMKKGAVFSDLQPKVPIFKKIESLIKEATLHRYQRSFKEDSVDGDIVSATKTVEIKGLIEGEFTEGQSGFVAIDVDSDPAVNDSIRRVPLKLFKAPCDMVWHHKVIIIKKRNVVPLSG